MADETLEVLRSIDRKLSAVIALLAEGHIRTTDPGRQRTRGLDRMLTEQGISGVEVGRLLGKSHQAVSQALARERKASVSPKEPAGTAKERVAAANGQQ